jgi:hypothetical protein
MDIKEKQRVMPNEAQKDMSREKYRLGRHK